MDDEFISEAEVHMRLTLELILAACDQNHLSYEEMVFYIASLAVEGLGGLDMAEVTLAAYAADRYTGHEEEE